MDLSALPPGGWWIVAGFLLLALELVAPGVFLVFIGAAAIAAGIFTWIFDLGTTFQFALFIIYSIVAVLIGKRMYQRPSHDESDGMLNERALQLKGRAVTVVQDFAHGEGRVRLGDSEWSARGPDDAKVGDRMEITDVEGTCLRVERAKILPPTEGA